MHSLFSFHSIDNSECFACSTTYFLEELKVVEVLINQCREKQILQGILSTWTEKNRVEVQRWRVGGGGLFRTPFLENLGMCFLGVTWGSRRSHGFYSTLQPAERLRNLGGGVGRGAKSQVVSKLRQGAKHRGGKKRTKIDGEEEGKVQNVGCECWLHDECGTLLGATAALISRIIRGDQQTNKQTNKHIPAHVSACVKDTQVASQEISQQLTCPKLTSMTRKTEFGVS